ncbi:DUF2489 domain-containing protein [Shewanella sp. NIFS-20-20]|uniref:DUF2489 domain-containing protein n=1 Tax=Shewanella sp. NIFS-20-20 TaxID=2853806 RepID=UPI001C447CBC|nr:DUF2489 domain-containing protein [Shewanella sp. NIFS-20-20]MBV7316107.1 DUF2489 domain-containing protein [Shewanella sp. NIFS-20-20]
MDSIWIIAAVVIIIPLAGYAATLLWRLRQQQRQALRHAAEAAARANAKREQVLGDISYIAQAMIEDRCELSEGVLRIGKLFDILSMTEQVMPQYPHVFRHYQRIESHPIMAARKALDKQQRMQLDLQRMKSEAELADGIMSEIQQIAQLQLPKTH